MLQNVTIFIKILFVSTSPIFSCEKFRPTPTLIYYSREVTPLFFLGVDNCEGNLILSLEKVVFLYSFTYINWFK